jgi:L-asparagine transporter-like permease
MDGLDVIPRSQLKVGRFPVPVSPAITLIGDCASIAQMWLALADSGIFDRKDNWNTGIIVAAVVALLVVTELIMWVGPNGQQTAINRPAQTAGQGGQPLVAK